MTRYFIVALLALSAAFSANAQEMPPANQVAIVALIITSGEETPVSKSVAHTLESLDAQVLTANAPSTSQMRSILKRFAAAAIDEDVALVYYDGAVLQLDGREFVAPAGITLRRRSDLLTKAIPLSALARATALAGDGGAVLVHSTRQGIEMIGGISLLETAPEARTGTSPILFASAIAASDLAETLADMASSGDDISLSGALAALADLDGVSISQPPMGQAMLRILPTPEVPEAVEAAPAPAEAEAEAEASSQSEPLSGLPQVGDTTPEADTAADVAAAPEAIASPETAAEASAPEAREAAQEPEPPVEEPTEPVLSIEELQASQDALPTTQKQAIQQHLQSLGFYDGAIDGAFGQQSAKAISAYQGSIDAEVTGVLTPEQTERLSE